MVNCQLCGQPFSANRSDANYCSNKCRSSATYQRKKSESNYLLNEETKDLYDGSESEKMKSNSELISTKEIFQSLNKIECCISEVKKQISDTIHRISFNTETIIELNAQLSEIDSSSIELVNQIEMRNYQLFNHLSYHKDTNEINIDDDYRNLQLLNDADFNTLPFELKYKIEAYRQNIIILNDKYFYKRDALNKTIEETRNLNSSLNELINKLNEELIFNQNRIVYYDKRLR